jgi:uncharacterized cupin superfamily protein
MSDEARIERTKSGDVARGEGWYVVNAREAQWIHTPELGSAVTFEGDARFEEYGINIQVLEPGQPNCMYHAEDGQEDFLVLSGECLLLVEGQERRLKAWDFFHAPPMTEHVFVGSGEGPCAILMVGSRREGALVYPASELALRHGAGVEKETNSGDVAYARFDAPTPGPMRRGQLPDAPG